MWGRIQGDGLLAQESQLLALEFDLYDHFERLIGAGNVCSLIENVSVKAI